MTTSTLPVTHPLLELCSEHTCSPAMLTDTILAQITTWHQGPSMTRARFDEGFECLHEVLTPFVNSVGWLHYVEKPEHPIKAPILIAHKDLLKACTKICPNLAFTKSVVTQVFQQLLKEKAFPELATKEAAEDWVDTMVNRFRSACRHCAQSRLKKPPPKWLQHIDGMAAAGAADDFSQASST